MSEKISDKHHSAAGKDTIYIDVDDEITAIIDKLLASPQKIVALVLPKRAAAFQSVVNMKLLKRSADHAKKNVVLITSDASLLSLAGGVGLHVAKSLQSKPEVPDTPEATDDKVESLTDDEPAIDKSKSLAELNGDDEETIHLDDDDIAQTETAAGSAKKIGKGPFKKFKIPNFNRFRLILLAGGGGLLLLIFLGVMAFVVLPKAKVVVSTDRQAIEISQDVNLKAGDGVTVDAAQAIVPATKQEIKKTLSQEVPATGQQNNGEKATGSIQMSSKDCTAPFTPPADVSNGSGVSSNGNTYITQKKAQFSLDDVESGCAIFNSGSINITAQEGGTKFNTAASVAFSVAGRSDLTASGAAAGGTDSIVKVLSQGDIDSAKQKIGSQDAEAVKQELTQALKDAELLPVTTSFATATPTTKQSANPGDKVETVTVTQEVVYSMLGVKAADLEVLVAEQVKTKIDTTKQTIVDYGLTEAIFTQLGLPQPDTVTVGFQTTVITGSDIKEDEIKQQVAGKKANEAEELIKAYPGVTAVEVRYSPFWVSAIPKKPGKITVVIEEPQVSDDASNTSQ